MIARFAGAALGLFAFSVTVIAGLCVRNPVDVILSRGILALFVFFMIGLGLGAAAQAVIREHSRAREAEIETRFSRPDSDTPPRASGGGVAETVPFVEA